MTTVTKTMIDEAFIGKMDKETAEQIVQASKTKSFDRPTYNVSNWLKENNLVEEEQHVLNIANKIYNAAMLIVYGKTGLRRTQINLGAMGYRNEYREK